MKVSHILPLAVASSAFVLPTQEVFNGLAIEDHRDDFLTKTEEYLDGFQSKTEEYLDAFQSKTEEYVDDLQQTSSNAWDRVVKNSHNVFESVKDWAGETKESMSQAVEDFQDWMAHEEMDIFGGHHGHHGKQPHHGPNQTVYELISNSKYTTKLVKLINKFDDLVEALNSTKANYTVFAPIDEAFERIPDHVKIPDDKLKQILAYHVIPDFYPAKRVLTSYTAPTLLKVDHLSDKPEPQRLAFKLGLRGLAVNFYSRVIAVNIFGTNGVIHGVKNIIVPPPNVIQIIDFLPGEFSTLNLALVKTGLQDKLNSTDHNGGTFFAPSNFAFQKLGTRVNAFLFSKYGEKYLKALLQYHVVRDHTLYTDALYKAGDKKKDDIDTTTGKFHIDLPTLLDDKHLSVDIASWGGWTSIHINGFTRVTVGDGVASDGVIHGVSNVLIPPKKLPSGMEQQWEGEELSEEDLKERLEPYVPKGDL